MISAAHYYIPKVNGLISFLINFYFILITIQNKNLNLGNYRYLLCYFSIINLICTLFDILVPISVHGYQYSFLAFIVGGPFVQKSEIHTLLLAIRCGLISAAYSILHCHFFYRWKLLRNHDTPKNAVSLWWFPCFFLHTTFLTGIWVAVSCLLMQTFLMGANEEKFGYVGESFLEVHGVDIREVNVYISVYQGTSYATSILSYTLFSIFFITSNISLLILIILRHLIIQMLNKNKDKMSKNVRSLHQQLIKALTVQLVIPSVVCLIPSFLTWLLSLFGISFGGWLSDIAVVLYSVFPFLDPLCIITYVPAFRRKVTKIFSKSESTFQSNVIIVRPA
ncbi:hypothetical protein CRE_11171 [Caenorhabditis remanei]|uniref:Uncharacterized protein n=1 Tax=Caenorhabditis remanei TaxID=31234 RepID=E3MQ48_CAERE|nr:hypothetical protein CRE_11171 [Caenorhabditis remanei]